MFRCIFPFEELDDVSFDDFEKAKQFVEDMDIPSFIKSENDVKIGFLLDGEFYYYH